MAQLKQIQLGTDLVEDTWLKTSMCFFFLKKNANKYPLKKNLGGPTVAQQKQIWLVSLRVRGQSLASLRGSRIRHCPELWCRSQMWLGSGVAVAVAGSCSSDSTPGLGTSICWECGPKTHTHTYTHTHTHKQTHNLDQILKKTSYYENSMLLSLNNFQMTQRRILCSSASVFGIHTKIF